MIGGGYAFPRLGSPGGEIGTDVRLFGSVYGRLLLDYYGGSGIEKNGETIKHVLGINVLALYKVPIAEMFSFILKIGGHYSSVTSQVSVFGVTYTDSLFVKGLCGGVGFELQISNRLLLYCESTLKTMMADENWYWLKAQMGLRIRVR